MNDPQNKSTLPKLIAELCPDGVEFKNICEIFDIRNGYTPSKAKNEFWENGTIPWFVMEDIRKNGTVLSDSIQHITPEAVKGKGLFKANSIIMATSATIGEHALITVDHLANQRFINLKVRDAYSDLMDIKFFFYYAFVIDEWCKKNTSVSSFATVDMAGFKKLTIPVPPMEVQREIVRILDKFTDLSALLETELVARKKQYAYYREKLFQPKTDWKHTKLLNLLSQPITDGPHTTPDFVSEGVPFVSVESVWDGRIHFEKKRGYITEEFDKECCKKYKPQKNDVYMVKSGSTTGKVAYVDTEERFNIWSPLAAMRVNGENSSRFLFHLLQTVKIQNLVRERCSHGSQPNLSMRVIEQFEVDVPPLPEQKRIADILDRFDALCNDLSSGIPAEIAARKKQYEYYRDRLLTFREKISS